MEITKYVCYNQQSSEYLRKHYYNVYNCQTRKNEKKEGGYVEVKLKIELLRQKYFNRADKLRLYRKCESPKFNEFEFGKVIGQIKAINDVMSILGYSKKDIDTGINNTEDNTEDIENEFER